jgi:hypothetical protein
LEEKKLTFFPTRNLLEKMSTSSKTHQLLTSIQEIAKVHDIEVTAKKIDKILKDGFNNLHIICGNYLGKLI